MAGGMNKRGSYGPMTERVRGRAPDASTPPPVPDRADDPPTVKHCWVSDRHGRLPGLLLEWQRRGDTWHGRVVRPVADDDGWIVVEEWLPSDLLDPG